MLGTLAVAATCAAAAIYQRREPQRSVLYRTIQTHLEAFLARTSDETGAASVFPAHRVRLAFGVSPLAPARGAAYYGIRNLLGVGAGTR